MITPSEVAGAFALAVILAFYATARVSYRNGKADGRLEERAEASRDKIEEARRARERAGQWATWEREHAEWKAKQAGRHDRTLITRARSTTAPLVGSGTGELRAITARADDFIARMTVAEEAWRKEHGS